MDGNWNKNMYHVLKIFLPNLIKWTAASGKSPMVALAKAHKRFPDATNIECTGAKFTSGPCDWPLFHEVPIEELPIAG